MDTEKFFYRFGNLLFDFRKLVLAIIFLVTAFFAWQIPAVKMLSDFADLLPQEHPYIKLHNSIRDTFGGANIVTLAVAVEEGDIFTEETLGRIHRITQALDSVENINHNLVTSLTHRNTRKIYMTQDGSVTSESYYDPHHGNHQLEQSGDGAPTIGRYTAEELDAMRSDVLANPQVYGVLVSPDLKAALIKGTLNEGKLDYGRVFDQIQEIRRREAATGVKIYATGHPVLVGWVDSYSVQIMEIFLYTVLIVLAILIAYTRRFYGVLLPLFGMVMTSIWGVGFMGLMDYNLDPLLLVVPFLISARALSHGIQKVERYFYELSRTGDRIPASRNTFNALFRPGALAIICDAAALFLIGLGSVPINDKMAVYASFWAMSMLVTVLIMVPMLLALLPTPRSTRIKHTFVRQLFPKLADLTGTPARSRAILFIGFGIMVAGAFLGTKVQVGEQEPGSPLLYRDHDFNVSSAEINRLFPGSEEMFIIARTDEKGGLKRPEVVKALEDFQSYMMLDDTLGGVKGLPNLITTVNQLTRNDDPRWAVVPNRESEVGGLMYMYMMSAPIPNALQQYVDTDNRLANMVFYYKDHTGQTIRRAIHMAKEWVAEVGSRVKGLHIDLAGGPVGVTAGINEEVYKTNLVVVPTVLALVLAITMMFYRSFHAGFMMLVSMGFATTLSYACMYLLGMGLNVNTVPMIAVGIGLGVDYSIYMMDRVREEMEIVSDLQEAIRRAVSTTGVAITFTATTLIGGIIMWVLISDLRFQADSARLLIIMLVLNGCAAIFLIPAWVDIFKPRFIEQAAEIRRAGRPVPLETEPI